MHEHKKAISRIYKPMYTYNNYRDVRFTTPGIVECAMHCVITQNVQELPYNSMAVF